MRAYRVNGQHEDEKYTSYIRVSFICLFFFFQVEKCITIIMGIGTHHNLRAVIRVAHVRGVLAGVYTVRSRCLYANGGKKKK